MVRELANARQAVGKCAADLAALEAEIAAEIPEYATTKAALKAAKDAVKAKEEALRSQVVNRYTCLGEKPTHPALGVRSYSELAYSTDHARKWAVEHQLYALLDLNASAFESVASVLYPGPLETLVRWQGTISSKLDEWAGEPEGEAEPA